jgi:hypothetical protein
MPPRDPETVSYQREGALVRIGRAVASGAGIEDACGAEGISVATYNRWDKRFTSSGREGLRPEWRRCGRRPMVEVSAQEGERLRALVAKTNAGRDRGSEVTAARLFAQGDDCSEGLREAILKDRTSKHSLPQSVRRAMRVPAAVVRQIRDPRAASLSGAYAPGTMRMTIDAETGERRRLRAGERQSWDDGSMNLVLWLPWPFGGCRCSDKFGVKVGRFQVLGGIDDATDKSVGASLVARPSNSYRAQDVTGALYRAWRVGGRPKSLILERGTWESLAVTDFLKAARMPTDHVYSPHHKLVESWWNRLWTRLSVEGPQIGRYRGEMRWETAEYMACRDGRRDPREIFLSVEQIMEALERSILWLDGEPIESRTYGTWVPGEKYEEEIARAPLEPIAGDLAWALAPERGDWTVRRDGMVGGRIQCPLGPSVDYYFAGETLHHYEGARVSVYFDPATCPVEAAVVLRAPHQGDPAGKLIASRVRCISDAPMVARSPEGWRCTQRDGHLADAVTAKRAARNAVRTEAVAIVGRRSRRTVSEVRDGWGNMVTVERGAQPGGQVDITTELPTRASRAPEAGLPRIRRGGLAVADDDDTDAQLSRIAVLEAAARASGQLISVR